MLLISVMTTSQAHATHTEEAPRYELDVQLDMKAARLTGTARIGLKTERELLIRTQYIKPVKISIDHKDIALPPTDTIRVRGSVYIEYEGSFAQGGPDGTSPQNPGVITGGAITPEAASLTAGWYPEILGAPLAVYSFSATVPDGITAVSEADKIKSAINPSGGVKYTFAFPYPRAAVSLIAGRYIVNTVESGKIEVQTYLYADDAQLSDDYIKSSIEHLKRYSASIGVYPYKRFAVVENFLQSGYSLPTMTLLGQSVMRLPFIRETSLSHEILHQWFGNSVYATQDRWGGWVEGLVTYLADQRIEADKGEGWLYRRSALTDYMAYVRPDNEIALSEFTMRTDHATRAVGYGKAAMVFHMLRLQVGEADFEAMLATLAEQSRFRTVDWEGIRAASERAYGHDLGWFFTQWVTRKGMPVIEVEEPRVIYRNGAIPNVELFIKQQTEDEGAYRMKLPLRIELEDGRSVARTVELTKARERFTFPIESGYPVSITLDPDYDTLRLLWSNEFAPVMARLAGDEHRILVLPNGADARYDALKAALAEAGFTVREEKDLKDDEVRGSSLLLADASGATALRLFAKAPLMPPDPALLRLEVRPHPMSPDEHVVALMYGSTDSIGAVSRRLLHYGRYGVLEFAGGANKLKSIAERSRGIRISLEEDTLGVRPALALTLPQIVRELEPKPVIYIGEGHTNYEDHRVQLAMVRRLHEQGRDFAIGMEMFQTPYQNALDDYVAGKTGEIDFLRKTEYFKRWGYDFSLYREVLLYAKEHGIPVVALNVKKEVIESVAKGGLDALDEADRKALPPDMDMAAPGYRQRLKDIYDLHRAQGNGSQSFENFYQSQVIWDEVMALSVADYMSRHPQRQMVVLCGQGHIEFGSGIPRRVARRNGKEYATLINSAERSMAGGIADYVIYTRPIEAPFTARLIVYLDEMKDASGGLLVKGFGQSSVAEAAGMQKDDVIYELDGQAIKTVEDLKILLLDKQPGDRAAVKVRRPRFFFGPKELELEVTFQ